MNLKKLILKNNECYRVGTIFEPKGIMLHSTGVNNPWLKRYIGPDDGMIGINKYNNHWNQSRPDGRQVCVHAFIGKLENGSIAIYQTLPWNMKGWHCGGSANNSHIGFEICEDDLKSKEYFNIVYKNALELCFYLCEKYNLNETNVICHSEGFKLGIASNHSDVMHWFPRYGKNMNIFRTELREMLKKTHVKELEINSDNFLVKIEINNLIIRKGPGIDYESTGKYTGIGLFTIKEISTGKGSSLGWGKLKSNAGWISLDFAKIIPNNNVK